MQEMIVNGFRPDKCYGKKHFINAYVILDGLTFTDHPSPRLKGEEPMFTLEVPSLTV